jgi:RHS repeat-associated protein
MKLNEMGNLVSPKEYSPFGTPLLSTCGQKIQARREYRLAHYHWDRETGFYAYGARFYYPCLARWTSPDPLGDVDGHNLYAYVGNNPVNCDDPSGTGIWENLLGVSKTKDNEIAPDTSVKQENQNQEKQDHSRRKTIFNLDNLESKAVVDLNEARKEHIQVN